MNDDDLTVMGVGKNDDNTTKKGRCRRRQCLKVTEDVDDRARAIAAVRRISVDPLKEMHRCIRPIDAKDDDDGDTTDEMMMIDADAR